MILTDEEKEAVKEWIRTIKLFEEREEFIQYGDLQIRK